MTCPNCHIAGHETCTDEHACKIRQDMNTELGEHFVTVTIPYAAADSLGESLTLTVPPAWESTVVEASVFAVYGPNYRRRVAEELLTLRDHPSEYRYLTLRMVLDDARERAMRGPVNA